jgi:hypothetical protein
LAVSSGPRPSCHSSASLTGAGAALQTLTVRAVYAPAPAYQVPERVLKEAFFPLYGFLVATVRITHCQLSGFDVTAITVRATVAGALEQFGGRYHLPPPISGHNAFYIWGPGGCTGQVIISIGITAQAATSAFGSVTLAAKASCKAFMGLENNAPILILRDPKEPFNVIWAQAKMCSRGLY